MIGKTRALSYRGITGFDALGPLGSLERACEGSAICWLHFGSMPDRRAGE